MELSIYYKGCWERCRELEGVCVRERGNEGRDRETGTDKEVSGKSLLLSVP